MTVAAANDFIVLLIGQGDGSDASATSSFTAAVSDNLLNSYTVIDQVDDGTVAGGANCLATNCHSASIWVTFAGSSSSIIPNLTPSNTQGYWDLTEYDVSGVVSRAALTSDSNVCSTNGCSTGPANQLAVPISFGGGTILFGISYGGSGPDMLTASVASGFTLVNTVATGYGAEYSSGNPTSPTQMPFTQTGGATNGYYAMVGAVFGASSFGNTNQDCLGACGGSPSSSSTYLATNFEYYYVGQAISGQVETVYNASSYISATNINAGSGIVSLAIYAGNTLAPTAANPMALIWSNPFTITNNTIGYLHSTPNINICSGCYFAVAIMATTTASRGSGASGSGIAIAETGIGNVLYKVNAGSSTLPKTIYPNVTSTPIIFLVAWLKFAIITTTVTSTVAASGTITVTTTSTELTYATNAAATAQIWQNVLFLFFILFIIPLIFAAIGAVTGNGTVTLLMFLAGLNLSVFIGEAAKVIDPSWTIFLALIDAIIALAMWKLR